MIKSIIPLKYITATRDLEVIMEVEIKSVSSDYETNIYTVTTQEFHWLGEGEEAIRKPNTSTQRPNFIPLADIESQTGTQKEKIEKALLNKVNTEKWYASSGTDFIID